MTGMGWIFWIACTGNEIETGQEAGFFSNDEIVVLNSLGPFPAPPDDPTNAVANNSEAAHLGQWLFFDSRLSQNNDFSCATCHDPDKGFGDGLLLSEAVGTTERHSPHLWNNAYNRWFFWDGRCDTAWCQALQPIEDTTEMNNDRLSIAHLVFNDAELRTAYEILFGELPDLSDTSRFPESGSPLAEDATLIQAWDGMAEDDQETINEIFSNLGKSIAAYERKLISKNSTFDQFWAEYQEDQTTTALSDSALRGLKIFVGVGNCHLCHSGPHFTNAEFHNIGLGPQSWLSDQDMGRYDGITMLLDNQFNGAGPFSDAPETGAPKLNYLTQGPEQLGQFKVPSLRSISLSPPYMHGGQLETLHDVVEFYNDLDQEPLFGHREDFMTPLGLNEADLEDMVAFLESLTGEALAPELMLAPDSPIP